ncbi:hypothetical protein GOODEAATRI_018501 [Goodea atripinnis]|uniref:Cadherin domain-containing protein n=1 Tax=Goodea atripinnis TaxID=208336 RepID=A0ABV0PF39_9TELE
MTVDNLSSVYARDGGLPPNFAKAVVHVEVQDVNDNVPVFAKSSYELEVPENQAPVELCFIKATDPDLGPGGQLEYRIADTDDDLNGKVLYFLSQEAHGAFAVDEETGLITTSAPLDREKIASYSFQVFAADLSPAAPRNSSAQVTVTILDVNDNVPFFIQDPLIIEVSSRRSQRVLATMKAEDKDFGANGSVFYRFATSVKGFSINSLTGEIQATEPLRDLTQAQRTLIVEAMDQGSPAQSAQGVVVIYVKEVEYNGIRFSRNARDAEYPDGTQKGISYSLFSGNKKQVFSISSSTGEIWVQSSQGLDFEDTPRLRLVVKAETVSSMSFMAVNLVLQDVNDNLPRFQLQNYVTYMKEAQGYEMPIIQVCKNPKHTLIGTEISLVTGNDVDSSPALSYSLQLDPTALGKFGIHRYSGGVSLTGPLDFEEKTWYTLTVRATDSQQQTEANITIVVEDINDNAPAFTHDLYQELCLSTTEQSLTLNAQQSTSS